MKIRFMLFALLLSGFGISQLKAMDVQPGEQNLQGGQNSQVRKPGQKIITPSNAVIAGLVGLTYKNPNLAQKVVLGSATVYSAKKAHDEFAEAKKPGFKNKVNFAGYVGMTLTSAWFLYQSLTN